MRRISQVLFFLLLVAIFTSWFKTSPLSAGDWHYFFTSSLRGFVPGVWAWDFSYGNGTGGNDIFLLGLNSYFLNGSFLFLTIFHFPWWLTERLMWYLPFFAISAFSSYFLHKTFFSTNKLGILTVVIVLANTYTLMLIGGGQVGVAIAFSFAPLVVALYGRLVSAFKTEKASSMITAFSILAGVAVGLQIVFDLRIAYITLIAVFLFLVFSLFKIISFKRLSYVGATFLIALLLNAFWILPQGIIHKNPLQEMGSAYTTAGAVSYFSFAKFENAIGLLHPNWPENIFGKVGFMRPEFLFLPILAFSSLLFINRKRETEKEMRLPRPSLGRLAMTDETNYILYFALLGLVGVFLAKGSNDPFGGIYLWMFDHVPGFVMFRDPTKWYLLIVMSYSMLIPYSVGKIYDLLKRRVG